MKKNSTYAAHKKFSKTKKFVLFVITLLLFFIFLIIFRVYFYDPCYGCQTCAGECCNKCCDDCFGVEL